MSPDVKGLVDTSISFSQADLLSNDDVANGGSADFKLHLFCRSSSEAQMKDVDRQLAALVHISPALRTSNVMVNFFPGWEPVVDSDLLREAKKSHKELFREEPHVYAVHAGLECGLLQGKYPDMVCISIGPTIKHAHSPDEK